VDCAENVGYQDEASGELEYGATVGFSNKEEIDHPVLQAGDWRAMEEMLEFSLDRFGEVVEVQVHEEGKEKVSVVTSEVGS